MRIAIVTNYHPKSRQLMAMTSAVHTEYCLRHDYDYIIHRNDDVRNYGFARLEHFLMLLKTDRFDWLMNMGNDAIQTNHTIKIESILEGGGDMILTTDSLMIQNDVMLYRNCRESISFLERVQTLYDQFCSHPLLDQGAMGTFIDEYIQRGSVRIVPQRTMNSYEYVHYRGGIYDSCRDVLGNDGEWKPGDYIFHAPGLPFATKCEMIARHIPQIVR